MWPYLGSPLHVVSNSALTFDFLSSLSWFFWLSKTFIDFDAMRENPPKMQKILNFQCNFHPTKQPLKCNMRPYLESSLCVVSKSALTFEFLVCLSRLFGCQRHLVILPRCAEIRQKRKKNVIFNLNSTQLDVENVKKKKLSPAFIYHKPKKKQ